MKTSTAQRHGASFMLNKVNANKVKARATVNRAFLNVQKLEGENARAKMATDRLSYDGIVPDKLHSY